MIDRTNAGPGCFRLVSQMNLTAMWAFRMMVRPSTPIGNQSCENEDGRAETELAEGHGRTALA